MLKNNDLSFSIPHCLPTGLTSLSMAENEVSDLNEVHIGNNTNESAIIRSMYKMEILNGVSLITNAIIMSRSHFFGIFHI